MDAILKGGPFDGLKVEVIGQYYARKFRRKNVKRAMKKTRGWFFEAHYYWDASEEKDGAIRGVFAGYFDGSKRCDKLGRVIKDGRR